MTYKICGYIIRKQEFRECDKIFTFYTQEQGKIRAVAQGVKKISSKLSGDLELLHHVSCTIAKGKQMDRIATVDVIGTYEQIKKDIKKLICALHCMEVLDHLVHDSQQDAHVYTLIGEMLDALAVSPSAQAPLIADAFLLKFRVICGYGAPKRLHESMPEFLEQKLSSVVNALCDHDHKKIHTLARAFVSEYAEKELKTQVFFDFFARVQRRPESHFEGGNVFNADRDAGGTGIPLGVLIKALL